MKDLLECLAVGLVLTLGIVGLVLITAFGLLSISAWIFLVCIL